MATVDWHKVYHEKRVSETRAVKQALGAAGIDVLRVGHGTGTAYGWLHVQIRGQFSQDQDANVIRIVQETTGRRGDYDGRISVVFREEVS